MKKCIAINFTIKIYFIFTYIIFTIFSKMVPYEVLPARIRVYLGITEIKRRFHAPQNLEYAYQRFFC